MNLKKNFLLLIFFIIIILQVLLSTNNNEKTSFRIFKWTVQDISIGKLIGISFFSGLCISTLLNTTITNYKKNTFENTNDNFEPVNNEEAMKSNFDIPPERDIRDSQPTISVNYRVISNNEDNNLNTNKNFSKSPETEDDWENIDNNW